MREAMKPFLNEDGIDLWGDEDDDEPVILTVEDDVAKLPRSTWRSILRNWWVDDGLYRKSLS